METRSEQRRIHRMEFDVEWPPGHVACYLIESPELILLDAGVPDRSDVFLEQLATHGYTPADVEHVVITHPHVDHIGQLEIVLDTGSPTVYAPSGVDARLRQEPDRLRDRVRRNCTVSGFSDDQLETIVEMTARSLERNAGLLPIDAVDIWMAPDRPTMISDLEVDPVHLPGHQADHLSYRTEIDGDTVLLAGDMGLQPFRPIVMHDGFDDGYREAFDAFYTALDRMADLDVERVYPGHGPIHDDLNGVVERDRRSLNSRLNRVVALVQDGYETAPQIASALAGDRNLDYISSEAMSALAYLDETDRLTRERIDGIEHYGA